MTYTVTLSSDRLWLSDPTDPSNVVVCGSTETEGTVDALDGDIRVYAGGIVEGVVRDQDMRSRTMTLVHLSAADHARVIAWRGTPLLLRTVDGERFFVFYLNVTSHKVLRTTPDDGIGTTTFDCDITFARVSFDETLL